MNEDAFRHIIQAAAMVVEDELVVVGSQALHGSLSDPPASLIRSHELDVYPLNAPERAIEIEGALGDGSLFHMTHGYYAHAVAPETITAPAGWEGRLVRRTFPAIDRHSDEAVGWCLSLPDLMLANLAARRPHDLVFVEEALRAAVVNAGELRRGIDLMPKRVRDTTSELLEGIAAKLSRSG